MLMAHEYIDGDYVDWFDARATAVERLLGPADPIVMTSPHPLYMGGNASLQVFRNYVPGVTYVTTDLIGLVDQLPNRLGNYELMMCTQKDLLWAQNLLVRLAGYTLENVLQPGETMSIGSAVPENATTRALLFAEPDLQSKTFKVRGLTSSLLLCVGITDAELNECYAFGSEPVLESLRDHEVFPYTNPDRPSVDV